MGPPFSRAPNVTSLARNEDVDGLIAATRYRDLTPGPEGRAVRDLGVPVRAAAITALAEAGAERALEAVSEALEDPSDAVRSAAVRVLSDWGSARPLADAVGRMQSDRGRAREFALGRLLELKEPESGPALAIALVHAEGSGELREDDAQTVMTLLEGVDSPGVMEDFVAALVTALGEREAVANRAEDLIVRLGSVSTPALIGALERDAAAERAAAILGRLRDRRALWPLVEALQHSDPGVRAESCAALGELRDPAAVEAILNATRDAEYTVRVQAAEALDRFGNVGLIVGVSALVRPMIDEAVGAASGGAAPVGRPAALRPLEQPTGPR